MKKPSLSSSIPGLTALIALLGLGALALLAASIWSFLHGQAVPGLLALGIGLLMGGAGLGLYRGKRWGVILFALLALLGSANHMINVLRRMNGLSAANTVGVLGAVVDLAVAILIPLGLAYICFNLWKQAR